MQWCLDPEEEIWKLCNWGRRQSLGEEKNSWWVSRERWSFGFENSNLFFQYSAHKGSFQWSQSPAYPCPPRQHSHFISVLLTWLGQSLNLLDANHSSYFLYDAGKCSQPICASVGRKVKVKSLSRVRLFATPWTVAYQAPPTMEFSRKNGNGLPFPPPGDLPNSGIEPWSPAL